MKAYWLGGGLGVVLAAVVCEVQVTAGVPGIFQGGHVGHTRIAAAATQSPRRITMPPSKSAPALAAPSTPSPSSRFVRVPIILHPPPVANRGSTLDLNAVRALRLRAPKHCGPMEAAPGMWVTVDCNRYSPISKAKTITHLSKVRLLKKGALKLNVSAMRGLRSLRNGAPPPTTGSSGSGGSGGGTPNRGAATGTTGEDYNLPEKVDHRDDGTEGPIKYQESVGSCTAFSLSSTMDNAIRRLERGDTTSSQHVWAHYGYPNMSVAGDANFLRPIASWDEWPYNGAQACKMYKGPSAYSCGSSYHVTQDTADNDPEIQAKLRQADADGRYKITQIDRLPLAADDIAGVLATGADVWAAFGISMDAWRSSAHTGDHVIPDWTSSDGGHAVVLAGYRAGSGGRQFLIHNSWGESWGDHGYAWISERSLSANLYDAYKIKVEPVDGMGDDKLTDDDCAEDELVDAVTGKCGKICPDDSRPSNGRCGGR